MTTNNTQYLSAASKRALNYTLGPEWFCEFKTHDLQGDFAYEEGTLRRDPSASGNPDAKVFPWDLTEVWYATSKDGWTWQEQGLAVGRGPAGSFDDRAVFTPEIFVHEGKYYLVYQVVKAPYVVRVKNQIGMAVADSPNGPWTKLDAPILSPADNGEWLGDEDDRFAVVSQGDFDSHKVHDPCLLHYNDKFYLYYKGEQMGERRDFGGRQIRWGVAISDRPEGPYTKSRWRHCCPAHHRWPREEHNSICRGWHQL